MEKGKTILKTKGWKTHRQTTFHWPRTLIMPWQETNVKGCHMMAITVSFSGLFYFAFSPSTLPPISSNGKRVILSWRCDQLEWICWLRHRTFPLWNHPFGPICILDQTVEKSSKSSFLFFSGYIRPNLRKCMRIFA